MALLAVLDGRELTDAVAQAAALLATVLGQDLDRDEAGVSGSPGGSPKSGWSPPWIPRPGTGTRPRRAVSTATRGMSASTPTPRIITATTVSDGNAGDGSVAEGLIGGLLDEHDTDRDTDTGESSGTGPARWGC